MWHIMHISIQRQHSHIKPIGLGRELEQRVDFDGPHAEGISRERFSCGIDDVVTQRDADVTRLSACHAVTCSHNVTT